MPGYSPHTFRHSCTLLKIVGDRAVLSNMQYDHVYIPNTGITGQQLVYRNFYFVLLVPTLTPVLANPMSMPLVC